MTDNDIEFVISYMYQKFSELKRLGYKPRPYCDKFYDEMLSEYCRFIPYKAFLGVVDCCSFTERDYYEHWSKDKTTMTKIYKIKPLWSKIK